MCVCIHEIVRFIIIMKMKMKNESDRYDRNRPKPIYSKYKKCLSMMLLICIKQHLSNPWISIQKQVKLGWKKALLTKKACIHYSNRRHKQK